MISSWSLVITSTIFFLNGNNRYPITHLWRYCMEVSRWTYLHFAWKPKYVNFAVLFIWRCIIQLNIGVSDGLSPILIVSRPVILTMQICLMIGNLHDFMQMITIKIMLLKWFIMDEFLAVCLWLLSQCQCVINYGLLPWSLLVTRNRVMYWRMVSRNMVMPGIKLKQKVGQHFKCCS